MTLPRCQCGRKAIAIAPGAAPVYAPGDILVDHGTRAQAWCRACAKAQGWLAEPVGPTIAAACATPRSARKLAATGKRKGKGT